MGNLVAVWWFKDALYMILLLLALLGFIMAVPKRDERGEISTSPYGNTKQDESPEPHSVVLDEPTTTVSSASVQVAAKHSPGKYLASKSSNVYHEPKCDWAKKVKKERRVWFGKKEDAWEKGYKAHGCVQ